MLLESSDLTEKEGREIQKNTIELLTKTSVSEPWVSELEPIKFPSSWVSVSSLLQISTFVSEWAAHSLTHGSLTAHAHDFRNTDLDSWLIDLYQSIIQKSNTVSETIHSVKLCFLRNMSASTFQPFFNIGILTKWK